MNRSPVLLAHQEGNVVRVYSRDRKGAVAQAAQFVNNNPAAPEDLVAVIADMGDAFAWLPPEVKPAAKPKEIEGPKRRRNGRRSRDAILAYTEVVHRHIAQHPTGATIAELQLEIHNERHHQHANNIRASIDRLGDRVHRVPGSNPIRFEAVRV